MIADPAGRRAPTPLERGAGRHVVVLAGIPRSLVNFRGPLLASMLASGHRVTACAPGDDPQVRSDLAALGVRYVPVPVERAGLNPLTDARTLAVLVRLLRQLQPDAFLGYTIKPVIYGSLAARLAGVAERHALISGLGYAFGDGGPRRRMLNGLVRNLYRTALLGSSTVFFQNPDDLQLFRDLRLVTPAQAVLVNGSGVDLQHFAPAPLPAEPASFLLIARLIAEKGIVQYVEAAREVKRQRPDAVFRLVGPLDSNPTAIRAADIEGWVREGTISYLGRLEDVRPAIADANVYVLPSYYREGTPRSILEAMAMGRPIITTNAPGCRETVEDGRNGFLVPPRDTTALSEAMLRLVDAPQVRARMALESLRIVRSRYDVHAVNATMLQAMRLEHSSEPRPVRTVHG